MPYFIVSVGRIHIVSATERDKQKNKPGQSPFISFPPALLPADGQRADTPAERLFDLADEAVAAQGTTCQRVLTHEA